MKATGIVRKMDRLGRVVIPMGLRRLLDINVDDPIEIFMDGESIVLKKYIPACYFCDSADDIITYGGRKICRECIAKLAAEAGEGR